MFIGECFSAVGSGIYQRSEEVTSQELAIFKASPIFQNTEEVFSLAVQITAFYKEQKFDQCLVDASGSLTNICLLTLAAKYIPISEIQEIRLKQIYVKTEIENCSISRVFGPLVALCLQAACFNFRHLSSNLSKAKRFFENRLIVLQSRRQLRLKDLCLIELLEKSLMLRTITDPSLEIRLHSEQIPRIVEEYRQAKSRELRKMESESRYVRWALATTCRVCLEWVD